jgi:hypothetical protein
LIAAGVDRESEKTGRKTTNKTLLDAERAAKQARRRARAGLTSGRRLLLDGGDEAGIRSVDAALASTVRSGADAERLAQQLDLLRDALAAQAVATAVAERGGPGAIAELELAAQTVRAARATSTRSRGTLKRPARSTSPTESSPPCAARRALLRAPQRMPSASARSPTPSSSTSSTARTTGASQPNADLIEDRGGTMPRST